MLLPKLELEEEAYRVYKTGIAFYDAARLVGVAHLFFGAASAEVEDKGSYWEVKGLRVKRDEEQVSWTVERLNPTEKERKLFYKNGSFQWETFHQFFSEPDPMKRIGRHEELKAEYDVALQIGTRGIDPLAKYEVLATRSTGEVRKKFKDAFQEVAVATHGRAFAIRVTGRTKRQIDEFYILPTFRERFVLSGFLDYPHSFSHPCGGKVAAVLASLSILLRLTTKRLPVVDFTYTREVKGPRRQPIFSGSGYLGLERLCSIWWAAVQKNTTEVINLLKNLRSFLYQTRIQGTSEQVQSLARWVAEFISNPRVDALTMIEHLKSRIRAVSQGQNFQGASAANRLLNRSELIKEAGKMLQGDLPEVPWQVSEALAKSLAFDERGWMNQLTRLENAPSFSQFIQQVEHIVSRGYYREQQERGQPQNIQKTLMRARDLANTIREMSRLLQEEKSFRAWKAIFLLDVLSRARSRAEEPEGQRGVPESTSSAAVQASKEG